MFRRVFVYNKRSIGTLNGASYVQMILKLRASDKFGWPQRCHS